jgi:hypothetical protein
MTEIICLAFIPLIIIFAVIFLDIYRGTEYFGRHEKTCTKCFYRTHDIEEHEKYCDGIYPGATATREDYGTGTDADVLDTQEEEKNKQAKRKPIPQDVKDKVWNRDGGKCVECGINENLEFDHIIPISKGGANTYRNIQLLCEHCNRSKSAKLG